MRPLTLEEFGEIKVMISKEMTALAKHENKNSYYTQVAFNICSVWSLSSGAELYLMPTPLFFHTIDHDYLYALQENPECFGTKNAKDVIHALYIQAKKSNWVWDEDRYTNFLSNEKFCLILYKKDKMFNNRILRIDLYRQLDESKEHPGYYDFSGGIFHALKHFSVADQCASLFPNQKVSLYDIGQLLWPIGNAFFEGEWVEGKRPNTYETSTSYLNKQFVLELYNEADSNVSFINSVIPKSV